MSRHAQWWRIQAAARGSVQRRATEDSQNALVLRPFLLQKRSRQAYEAFDGGQALDRGLCHREWDFDTLATAAFRHNKRRRGCLGRRSRAQREMQVCGEVWRVRRGVGQIKGF